MDNFQNALKHLVIDFSKYSKVKESLLETLLKESQELSLSELEQIAAARNDNLTLGKNKRDDFLK